MNHDNFIYFGDSYIDIQGNDKAVRKFVDDALDGKIKMRLSTNPRKTSPKAPVN